MSNGECTCTTDEAGNVVIPNPTCPIAEHRVLAGA